MQVGQMIKLYLVEKNISQVWLSMETKISTNTLCALLNGKRKMSIEEYKNIMDKLHLPYTKFIEEK